ncbi:hypothetical protein PU629_00795 [Pullulanibacillus sp. KACC 23026]|uniref:hypothetical protein n=1 Tax=Pullulanibacillus sp. KACC 23026 TaxID=3028315 RepID=UPI0023AF6D2B|nr:hypothetical protein [Pullulanibacillus sp. KACC 23026]WEG12925.1 hypothetical protein PU629_00795 [Pullulanibacillus sp. KACC 23026]
MKRALLFSLMTVLFLASCGTSSAAVSSSIIVVNKGYTKSQNSYWIQVYDPKNARDTFKIIVKDKMAWSLLKNNQEYFSVYIKKGNQNVLKQIRND